MSKISDLEKLILLITGGIIVGVFWWKIQTDVAVIFSYALFVLALIFAVESFVSDIGEKKKSIKIIISFFYIAFYVSYFLLFKYAISFCEENYLNVAEFLFGYRWYLLLFLVCVIVLFFITMGDGFGKFLNRVSLFFLNPRIFSPILIWFGIVVFYRAKGGTL